MRKCHRFYSLMILLIFFSSSSSFAFYISSMTGESLLKQCNSEVNLIENKKAENFLKQGIESGECAGYIAGVEDMHTFYSIIFAATNYQNKKILLYCLPKDVTPLQLAKIIVKYLNDHPEKLNKPGIEVVIDAYHFYFPCQNQ